MGMVAVTLKAMPENPEVDMERIKKEIGERLKEHQDVQLKGIEEKDIAFGLKFLEVLLLLPDSKGTTEIEETISKIEGVKSVESGEITLL